MYTEAGGHDPSVILGRGPDSFA
ncbi:uncharacterized protein G2W53_037271 [Senna tora]|uniref:Uncharacterized protein n=1 Tax=Senna tora TaxID=362788 RepID=A0A834W6U9_9FABA|nr:uncharacterized protein G2W53_037271 [Senna tora]